MEDYTSAVISSIKDLRCPKLNGLKPDGFGCDAHHPTIKQGGPLFNESIDSDPLGIRCMLCLHATDGS